MRPSVATAYYADKIDVLRRIFGSEMRLTDDAVVVGARRFPVVDDVIVTLPPEHMPSRMATTKVEAAYSRPVQSTFGDQWRRFSEVTNEHQAEFTQYFDLIQLDELGGSVVADLGCGSGRYAVSAAPYVETLVLIDFSDSIFVARQNLADHAHAVFVLGDVLDLPFQPGSFDLAYSLGVLHHLPVHALDAVRRLVPLTERLLVYLYYALDNRPWYFRRLLGVADRLRLHLCRVRSPVVRAGAVWAITLGAYWPLARIGAMLSERWRSRIPLAEFYTGKSLRRLRQDAHDRFLTPIEQRVTRAEIGRLADEGMDVRISAGLPYWHFVCSGRGS